MVTERIAASKQGMDALIEPLRQRKITSGDLYVRDAQIMAKLIELSDVAPAELSRRVSISSQADPDYVPSECILYFMRKTRTANSDHRFESFFRILRERVLRRLPRVEGPNGYLTALTAESIRDDVFGRFVELVAADRATYDERLDFFEVRFDQAIKRLILTAREKALLLQNRSTSIETDDATGEPSPEVELAAADFHRREASEFDDPGFRLRLDAAIDGLPTNQGRIIQMLRQGVQIDSKEKGQVTIANALDLSEKTVRNQRDRAYATLRDVLSEGEGR